MVFQEESDDSEPTKADTELDSNSQDGPSITEDILEPVSADEDFLPDTPPNPVSTSY